MPIYDYYCEECDYEFESLTTPWESLHGGILCPFCRTIGVKRLPTKPGGYVIKGDNSSSTKPKKK